MCQNSGKMVIVLLKIKTVSNSVKCKKYYFFIEGFLKGVHHLG